jgi:hypothetical protein
MSEDKKELNFDKEVRLLDQIYADMVDAIHNKPESNNVEDIRIYLDNVFVILNRTVFRVQEIKNDLEKQKKLILETWNPPA